MTKHHKVTPLTELQVGDFVLVKGRWAEIYCFSDDHGTLTSQGWICRTELYEDTKRIGEEIEIGQKWVPKTNISNLHWKLTKVFLAEDGETVYRLEKYQGGRNSPALLTKRKLLQNFKQDG